VVALKIVHLELDTIPQKDHCIAMSSTNLEAGHTAHTRRTAVHVGGTALLALSFQALGGSLSSLLDFIFLLWSQSILFAGHRRLP
jgi:hypothetical protein